jgi:hypothetical protein
LRGRLTQQHHDYHEMVYKYKNVSGDSVVEFIRDTRFEYFDMYYSGIKVRIRVGDVPVIIEGLRAIAPTEVIDFDAYDNEIKREI